MPTDIGQLYSFDPTAIIDGLKQIGIADTALREGLKQSGAAATSSFAEAARLATSYSDRLAGATAEQRAAAAATASAREAVRQLTQANRELAAAQKASSSADEVKRLGREIAKNTGEIQKAKQAIQENVAATQQERAAVEAVREARRQEVNQTKLAAAAAKDAATATKQQSTAASFFGGVIGKVTALFGGLFAVSKLKEVTSDVIETTSEFQRLEAVLTTINNGDAGKGQQEFAALRAFTLKNPFEIAEVTEGYVKLRNVGINPTLQQLQQLADLAAASGKSFDTVTSGLLGATTGRFAQLKQFGITARQQGDEVALTFRGVTTVVNKSQDAIASYVLGLGALNGVAGATERIMQTTGGRITNLKDSFTELFAVIGDGNTGVLNSLIQKLTIIATRVRENIKSQEQKGLDQVASTGALTAYGATLDKLFTLAGDRAKKAGTDIGFAINYIAAQQTNLLEKQLSDTENRLKDFQRAPFSNAKLATLKALGGDNYASEKQYADDRQALLTRQALLRGEIGLIKERGDTALKGDKDDVDQLGLIATLKAKITAEEKKREESTSRKEIHVLNLQIIADNKALDALLEKQAKKRADTDAKLQAALRALYAERATLQDLAAKAAIKNSDDEATRAKAVFNEALRQTEVLKQKLIEREAAVRKAGGRGVNADGAIDGVQAQALTQLRLAALDEYYTSLYKITAAREQRLFDLRADSDQKEIDTVNKKYDAMLAAQRLGQSEEINALDEAAGLKVNRSRKLSQEEVAIAEARERELTRVRFEQAQKRSDQVAALASANANLGGQTFGAGAGISEIDAKRAEKKALLEIEQQHARDVLNNSLLLGEKEGQIARAQAQATLARIKNDLDQVEREKIKHAPEDFLYKLILGKESDRVEARAALKATTDEVLSSVAQMLDAESQAAETRAQQANQSVNELSTSIAAQIALREEGSASNIKGLIEEQNKQKALRREALEEQRKIAKEKVILDALTQASSVATAVANVLAEVAFPYNLIASAALVASFVYTKAQAFEAASKQPAGYFTGGFTPDGGKYEEAGVVHKGEFVANQELTKEHRALFEALHMGRRLDGDAMASLAPLLPAMPETLLPDYSLPDRLRSQQQQYNEQRHGAGIGQLDARLAAIERTNQQIQQSNQQMAEAPTVTPLGPDKVELRWPNGNTKVVTYTN